MTGYCLFVFTLESLFLCFWHKSKNILKLKSSFLEQGGEATRDFGGKKSEHSKNSQIVAFACGIKNEI